MRKNQRIFIVLFTFFIVVALGSLILLNANGSVFNRNRDSFGAEPSVLDNSTIIADEAASVASTEEVVPEPEPEPVKEEPAKEEPAAPEPAKEQPARIRYFTYTVSTKSTVLNVRETPSTEAAILMKLPMSSKGYILKPGSEWSLIHSEQGTEGYCFNQYLVLTEVTAEDFPEEIRERVEAPDEELPSDIFGE